MMARLLIFILGFHIPLSAGNLISAGEAADAGHVIRMGSLTFVSPIEIDDFKHSTKTSVYKDKEGRPLRIICWCSPRLSHEGKKLSIEEIDAYSLFQHASIYPNMSLDVPIGDPEAVSENARKHTTKAKNRSARIVISTHYFFNDEEYGGVQLLYREGENQRKRLREF